MPVASSPGASTCLRDLPELVDGVLRRGRDAAVSPLSHRTPAPAILDTHPAPGPEGAALAEEEEEEKKAEDDMAGVP